MNNSDLKLNYPWLDNSQNREIKCCLCGPNSQAESVFNFQLNDRPYQIKKCPNDGLMYLFPQPSGSYADSLYSHPSYFSGEDDMYGLCVEEEKSKQIAKIRLAEISTYAPRAQSLLEIGSAYGHLLLEAKDQGWSKVAGVEFSEQGLRVSRDHGLAVVKNLDELAQQTFEVIALYSVLEHLIDPAKFLLDLKKFSRPDSFIFIRVPQMSEAGPWLSLLDHFWHFNEPSLERLLHACGYQKIASFPSGIFQGLKHPGVLASFTIVCRPQNQAAA